MNTDVVIVGAGPAGIFTALEMITALYAGAACGGIIRPVNGN